MNDSPEPRAGAKRGRPPRIAGEPASERIWAYVTKRERAALAAACHEMGDEDLGAFIRDAVNEQVEEILGRRVFSNTAKSQTTVS